MRLVPLDPWPTIPVTDDRFIWSTGGMVTGKRKLKCLAESQPQCQLSTTNPIWTTVGLNLGIHSSDPATNYLSYDMKFVFN